MTGLISVLLQSFKRAVQSTLLFLGYQLVPVSGAAAENVDFLSATKVKDSHYYSQYVGPCPLFSPWLGHPDFKAFFDGVEPYTLVPPERCYMLLSLARNAVNLPGDFAECGVWKGGTALMLARVLKDRTDKTLYLFDSFEGLPEVDPEKDSWFQKGQYSTGSMTVVKDLLRDFQSIVDIRPGWIPDTFNGLENRRYAFVHIDVDIYQSNLDCCKYFYPRMIAGGVMLFDEYAFAAAAGEKQAVDEFFADKPEIPIVLVTGQALVLKLASVDDARLGNPRAA
jgi:O-methyltransferase